MTILTTEMIELASELAEINENDARRLNCIAEQMPGQELVDELDEDLLLTLTACNKYYRLSVAEPTSCEALLEVIEDLFSESQWQGYIELCAEQDLEYNDAEGLVPAPGATADAITGLRAKTAERLHGIAEALVHGELRPADEALLQAIARSDRHNRHC